MAVAAVHPRTLVALSVTTSPSWPLASHSCGIIGHEHMGPARRKVVASVWFSVQFGLLYNVYDADGILTHMRMAAELELLSC